MTKKELLKLQKLLNKFEKDTGYKFKYYSSLKAEIKGMLLDF